MVGPVTKVLEVLSCQVLRTAFLLLGTYRTVQMHGIHAKCAFAVASVVVVGCVGCGGVAWMACGRGYLGGWEAGGRSQVAAPAGWLAVVQVTWMSQRALWISSVCMGEGEERGSAAAHR